MRDGKWIMWLRIDDYEDGMKDRGLFTRFSGSLVEKGVRSSLQRHPTSNGRESNDI